MTSSKNILERTLDAIRRTPRAVNLLAGVGSKSAALDSLTYRPGIATSLPRRGAVSFLRAYREAPLLRAVVSKIADRVASVPLYVEANVGSGWQYLPHHPIVRLWERGGPGLSGFALRKISAAYIEILGEAFIGIGRDNRGIPNRLYALPPHWIHATPTPERPLFSVRPTNASASAVDIPEADIVWIKDPDLEDPYGRGSGIAQSLEDEINVDEYAAKHAAAFFANHARPDLIIQGKDEPLNRDEAVRLEEKWYDKFRGVGKKGKPLFSARRLEVTEVGQGFGDLGIDTVRKFERDLILMVYGMSPEIMGVVENSNRSTIENADYILAANIVRPRSVLITEAINGQLAPQFGAGLRVGFEDPVREDEDRKIKAATDNREILTINERRDMIFGLPPLPDDQGARRIMPINVREVAVLDAEQGSGKSAAISGPAASKAISGDVVGKAWDEDDIERLVGAAVAEAIADSIGPILIETIAAFGSAAVAEYGFLISFDLADPRVADFVQTFSGDRIRDLTNATSQNALRATLSEGIAAGESSDRLADRIRAVFGGRRDNAPTIARTEIVRASNFATSEAFHQAGVEQKEWLTTRDGKARDSHRNLDGTIVAEDGLFFSDNGYSAPYPGEFGVGSEDINCRCSILPVFPELEGEDVSSVRSVADTEEKRVELFEVYDRRRATFEDQAIEAIVAAFDSQEQAVLAELNRFPTGTA